jgi:hypothetical protein
MMYRVVHEKSTKNLAVVGVKPSVLHLADVMVTDGNAANSPTRFFKTPDGLKVIDAQWRVIQAEYWNDLDGSKRKIMAECLVPERIPPEYVHSIFVADHDTKMRVEELAGPTTIPVVPEPNIFFKPSFAARIGNNISLVEGDMFFSGMLLSGFYFSRRKGNGETTPKWMTLRPVWGGFGATFNPKGYCRSPFLHWAAD